MWRRYVGTFVVLAVFCCYIVCYMALSSKPVFSVFHRIDRKRPDYVQAEEALLNFIENNMAGQDGSIFTRIKDHKPMREVLSESVGLFMEYCLERNRKDLFDRELAFLKKYMIADEKFIKWRIGDEEGDGTCNTAIDDLRIIRALLEADIKWNDKGCYNLAGFIQQGIYETQVEDLRLYEFYDWNSNTSRKNIPLCYIDLCTFDTLRQFNREWQVLADRMLPVINEGRMSRSSPFFFKYYDYIDEKYLADEEYSRSEGICLIYTLYTVLHLKEFNRDTEIFTQWLKNEMNKGKLYAWYNPDTLKPSKKMESTAVYALAAIYAKNAGEVNLYYKLIDRMLYFMVKDERSPYYGGFGNEKKGEFYSFDNLTALYALALHD